MSAPAASLVLRQLPADAPRAVHAHIVDLSAPDSGARVSTKVLHSVPSVLTACSAYTFAHWESLRVVVVPAPHAPAFGLILEIAVLRDDTVVAGEETILGATVVHHVSFGTANSVPRPVEVPIDLEVARLSSLIKPAPIEMRRAALGFRFVLVPLTAESSFSKNTVAAKAYISGVIRTAGAA